LNCVISLLQEQDASKQSSNTLPKQWRERERKRERALMGVEGGEGDGCGV